MSQKKKICDAKRPLNKALPYKKSQLQNVLSYISRCALQRPAYKTSFSVASTHQNVAKTKKGLNAKRPKEIQNFPKTKCFQNQKDS